ncbi:hypothetical protein GCM10010497_10770 [Streptomyces cinereoruber]|uniref:Uncharacterized protein n=1 Tax=Streptomyces cinereoruber TaxID=67260 RepID=A0AAV4KHP1_9ACTN|nr:hypothetical protein GCM10010497_10770 [Streptomyces cinereoruber]
MRTDGRSHLPLRAGITLGAVLTAPLLLLAGGFAYDRLVRHLYRDGGPGPYSKEEGWVHPGYFVMTNDLVRALTWPTRRWNASRLTKNEPSTNGPTANGPTSESTA